MISLLLPFATTQGNISEAIGSLSAVLAECGYFLSIHVTGSSSPKERTTLELLRSQNIAALVYYPKRDNIHLEKLNDFMFSGCPIVIVDKQTDCPYLNNVVCDNYDGGRQTRAICSGRDTETSRFSPRRHSLRLHRYATGLPDFCMK